MPHPPHKPPHEEILERLNRICMPPHALPIKNANKVKFLVISLLASTSLTFGFALLLNHFNIPIIVILPTSAPIWVGLTTIGYMVQTENNQR